MCKREEISTSKHTRRNFAGNCDVIMQSVSRSLCNGIVRKVDVPYYAVRKFPRKLIKCNLYKINCHQQLLLSDNCSQRDCATQHNDHIEQELVKKPGKTITTFIVTFWYKLGLVFCFTPQFFVLTLITLNCQSGIYHLLS